MGVTRALAVFLALVVLASLPCLVAWAVVSIDDVADRAGHAFGRLRRRRTDEPVVPRPPIERIAADLRRLSAELIASRPRSAVRHEAIARAYDEKLDEACEALAIEQHLDELTGFDRELERIRVEGLLEAAGITLRPPTTKRPREWR